MWSIPDGCIPADLEIFYTTNFWFYEVADQSQGYSKVKYFSKLLQKMQRAEAYKSRRGRQNAIYISYSVVTVISLISELLGVGRWKRGSGQRGVRMHEYESKKK